MEETVLRFVIVVLVGGVVGWLATRLFKADKQNSIFMYAVLGVIGAVVGKIIIEFLGFEVVGQGIVVDFIVAFVGATALVGVSKLVAEKIAK